MIISRNEGMMSVVFHMHVELWKKTKFLGRLQNNGNVPKHLVSTCTYIGYKTMIYAIHILKQLKYAVLCMYIYTHIFFNLIYCIFQLQQGISNFETA